MKRLSGVLLLLCLMCYVSSAFAQTAADTFNQAKALFEQGNYADAKPLLASILDEQTNPEPGETYFLLLKCHFYLKDHASVADLYTSHHARVAGTNLDPAARFTYANSLYENAGDADAALPEYEYIVATFPDSPYAAPGSLLKIGTIYTGAKNSPLLAIPYFDTIINDYPNSPYGAAAYIEKMEAGYQLGEETRIKATFEEFKEQFPESPAMHKATFKMAEFYLKVQSKKFDALKYYGTIYKNYPTSSLRALAMLRIADIVPLNNLEESVRLYTEVIERYPDRKSEVIWALNKLGQISFMNRDYTMAAAYFTDMLSREPAEKLRREAEQYLEALNNPESVAAMRCQYDSATRLFFDCARPIQAIKRYSHVVSLSEQAFFQEYCRNAALPLEERAQREYEVCHALFQLGYDDKALALARGIIERYPDSQFTRYEAEFMTAFLTASASNYEDAINRYSEIFEEQPEIKFAPRVLLEIGRCYMNMRDELSAMRIYELLADSYPNTPEGRQARTEFNFISYGKPDLTTQYHAFKVQTIIEKGKVILVQQPEDKPLELSARENGRIGS